MKHVLVLAVLLLAPVVAAERSDTIERLKLGEAVFEHRFPAKNVERTILRHIDAELIRLERVPAAKAYVDKIRKLIGEAASAVVANKAFRSQYASWIASQMSRTELEQYLQFLRSDLGKKIADLDDRVQPLLSEAIARSGGRLEAVPLLLEEARAK